MGQALPAGLGPAGAALFEGVTRAHELRADELELLAHAAREVDLIEQLEAVLRTEGASVPGSTGQQRLHPAVSEIRQHRMALTSLLRALHLDDLEDDDELAGVPVGRRATVKATTAARASASARFGR